MLHLIGLTVLLATNPVLSFLSYLGGTGFDRLFGIAQDGAGNVYVAGYTTSPNFPVVGSPLPFSTPSSLEDVAVAKINTVSGSLVWCTHFGGLVSSERAQAIATDASGNVYLTGYTNSPDYPTTANAVQRTLKGNTDAFYTKLGPQGQLLYSTFLGGSQIDKGSGIGVDTSGNVIAVGTTYSTDYPTTANAFQPTNTPSSKEFVTKISPTGALVYSTYLGGSSGENGAGVALDAGGVVYVTGTTTSTNFPVRGGYQTTYLGATDAYLAKLDTTKAGDAGLLYSTYLGGSSIDNGFGVAVDGTGNAYLTGYTLSANFPLRNPLQSTRSYGDAFVSKLDTTKTGDASLIYSTYLGGSYVYPGPGGADYGYSIAVDGTGSAYVVGYTDAINFPLMMPFQSANAGGLDAFVSKLSPSGTTLVYSSYLGGAGTDIAWSIVVDPTNGAAFMAGETNSTNLRVTPNAFQPAIGGGGAQPDGFVARIDTGAVPPPTPVFTSIAVSPAAVTVRAGSTQQFTAVALNQFGQPMASQPVFVWSVSGGATISSTGLFALPGTYTVAASAGGKTGTALVTAN